MKSPRSGIKVFIVGVAIIAVAAILVVIRTKHGSNDTIIIGADLALSGKFGYFGQQLQKGLQMAEADGNARGEKPAVRILFQDNRHDASEAVAIFEQFATVDRVSAAISIYSPMSKVIRDNAVRHRIPLVTTYTTAKDITNEWTFRDFPGMDEQVSPLAKYSYDRIGLRRVSCILFQSDFGQDGFAVFRKVFTEKGGTILRSEELPLEGSEDLVRDVVAKIAGDKPDGVFLVLSAKTLGLAVKRLRENKYEGVILSVVMFDSPEVREAAGSAAEGVYFPSISFDIETNPSGREFAKAYKAKFGEAPGYMVVYGYTIGQYLIDVVRQARGDRELILQALKKLDIQSIRGPVRVQPDGSIRSPVALYHVESSRNVKIEE